MILLARNWLCVYHHRSTTKSLNCGLNCVIIQGVPLPTKPGSSLIIPKPIKILQRDLNRSTFVAWEMKRNMSVVKLCLYVSECVCSKIIKELPGLVGSGTPYICLQSQLTSMLV